MTVWVPCVRCHPRIVPASVANTNMAREVNDQKTVPVGWIGTCTTSGTIVPSALYSVERSVPLSATHHGVVGPAVRPHALTRVGSRGTGTPGTSRASFFTPYTL